MCNMRNKLFFLAAALVISSTASASRIVYLAEQDNVYVPELYLVDLASPGKSLKLNRSLTPFSDGVSSFDISPDGSRIVFAADQAFAGDTDLYVVDIRTPGTWTKLGSLPAGHRELVAKFSPDGSKVAFTASDSNFADIQLYVVDLSSPAVSTRVNGDLAAGGSVSMTGFDFTPDGSHVIYVAGELERKYELYAVDLTTPRRSSRLNASGGSIGDSYEGRFHVLPDGKRVVYSAVWRNQGVREVHVVSIDAPGSPSTLNAPFQAKGYLSEFTVSHDGRYVAYAADQETDGVSEVYLVDVNRPGLATKISGAVQGGGGIVQFTLDNQYIIFSADGARNAYERDLYAAPVDLGTSAFQLSAPLNGGQDIGRYAISADGTAVAYRIIAPTGFDRDLMVARLDAPGSAIKVNGPLPDGALDSALPQFGPDGTEVAFLAIESLNGSAQELFFSRVSAPGSSIRLNGPLVRDGMVASLPHSFEFLPASAPATGGTGGTGGSGSSQPSDNAQGASGGGGAISWFSLVCLMTAIWKKRRQSVSATREFF